VQVRRTFDIPKVLQFTSIIVLMSFVLRGHPPVHAQNLSGTDMVQNNEIAQNKATLDSLQIQLSKQQDAINGALNTISGIQGEERGLAGILILLQIGQFVFRVKSGAKA
jgi:hypothetical protein